MIIDFCSAGAAYLFEGYLHHLFRETGKWHAGEWFRLSLDDEHGATILAQCEWPNYFISAFSPLCQSENAVRGRIAKDRERRERAAERFLKAEIEHNKKKEEIERGQLAVLQRYGATPSVRVCALLLQDADEFDRQLRLMLSFVHRQAARMSVGAL